MRAAVEEAGKKLGLDGSYIPHSYIEQVQLEEMTEELRHMTMEMKDKLLKMRRLRMRIRLRLRLRKLFLQ